MDVEIQTQVQHWAICGLKWKPSSPTEKLTKAGLDKLFGHEQDLNQSVFRPKVSESQPGSESCHFATPPRRSIVLSRRTHDWNH
eukprot:2735707-Amphidinium_carterae.4